jgi:hypothetical protein
MSRVFRHRPSPAMVVALIALLVALGGVAFASIPGPGGVVKGCYSKSNGSLRVIDSKKDCSKKHERTLSWNQKGPRGLRGIQGGQGLQGIRGTDGQGIQGPPGPTFAAAGGGTPFTDPPANPDESSAGATGDSRHFAFTLPVGGKVYVRFWTPRLGLDCSSGLSRAGLYLDNNPVPKSDISVLGVSSAATREVVAVAAAGAGPHAVEVRLDCPTGTISFGFSDSNATWTVVLLGG